LVSIFIELKKNRIQKGLLSDRLKVKKDFVGTGHNLKTTLSNPGYIIQKRLCQNREYNLK